MRQKPLLLLLLVFLSASWCAAQTPVTARDYLNRAKARQRNQDPDGAIADYTKPIALDPKYAAAYERRGVVRSNKGDFDGAIADFTRAIALNPKFAVVYVSRGLILLRQGKDLEAEEDFKKAVELDSQLKPAIERQASKIRLQRKSLP